MKKLLFIILLLQLFNSQVSSAQDTTSKLGYTGWNHMALQVQDIEASKTFYREIIGLKPVAVPDNLKAIRGWFDAGNGQMIHLLAGRMTPVVNDKFLTGKNIKFHKQVRFDGVTQIYFADPDGYLIELNQK
jgi:catechol 2,3-dioxygenase-like lactoylglutathione lyase family enzyme